MSSIPPPRLDRIKVQTARMLEMYTLLKQEIQENSSFSLAPQDLDRLSRAIATIEANMRQLQVYFSRHREQSSSIASETDELEDLLKEVLDWVQEKDD